MVRYYVEKWADLKNQTLKKSAGTQNCYAQRNNPGICNITIALKWGGGGGVPFQVHTLNQVIY